MKATKSPTIRTGHISLTEEHPERFREQTRRDKVLLEFLSGKPVVGFRAPRFSLTRQSLWVVDILGELGFKYSSSIMPTSISLYGMAETKTEPFRWPNGLIELPLPVAILGKWRIPFLGGIYLYAQPRWLLNRFLRRCGEKEILWTYTHPYDFDRTESFKPMPDTPLWVSVVLWLARQCAEKTNTLRFAR